jgi:Right handed beta helix region/Dockerin type I domain
VRHSDSRRPFAWRHAFTAVGVAVLTITRGATAGAASTAPAILFVAQPPFGGDFASVNAVFANQQGNTGSGPHGGDLCVRYGDGTLRNLTAEAGGGPFYYVAPNGNDGNAGTQSAPWLTLQKAGDVAHAGDTVIVLPGTYRGFRPRQSGTAQAPIRFLAQPGAVVTSPGPSNSNSDNIWVRDVDYIVIDGFESRAAPRSGVAVQGEPDANATGVVIRNCHCHDNGRWGIFTGFARDLLIEDNETSFSAAEHGIYVSNSGDRPVVRRNHAHHNHASGIQLNADPAQQGDDPNDPQGDGIIEDALIEDNVIHDNGAAGGAAINLASVRSSLVRNNLLYANSASGIAGWDDGEGSNQYGTRDNRLLGNTIVQPANGRFAIALKNGSINNQVFDNILIHGGTRGSLEVDPASQPGLQSDYNVVVNVFSDDDVFLSLAQWRSLGFDLHSVVADAASLFASSAAADFHLRPTSPAIDSGIARVDLPVDLEGRSRPQGPGFDIGALEVPGPAPSPSATRSATPSATPTRTPTRTPTSTRTPTQTNTPAATSTSTRTNTPAHSPTATPSPTRTRTPSTTPTPSPSPTPTPVRMEVNGLVTYHSSSQPVAGVEVHVTGAAGTMAVTDGRGEFGFSGLAAGDFQIEPRKIGGDNGAISSLDAAYALQASVGMRNLTTEQRIACDVTGNGSVSALDAARILQRVVGITSTLPVAQACGSDWAFVPDPDTLPHQVIFDPIPRGNDCRAGTIAFEPLDGDAPNQDFRAILFGDCTGNWSPAAGSAAFVRKSNEPLAHLGRPRRRRTRGKIVVPLSVGGADPFHAFAATLTFEPARVRSARVRRRAAASAAVLAVNSPRAGRMTVALASANPVDPTKGAILEVIYELNGRDRRLGRVGIVEVSVDE